MRFLLLCFGDEDQEAALPQEERRQLGAGHGALAQAWTDQGVLLANGALGASAAGVVVRPATGGGHTVVEGPLFGVAEQPGAFYLVECADRDEAVAMAAAIPAGPGAAVEVRPVPF
jgi:hypothetical protein